jgi:hypothetical protein
MSGGAAPEADARRDETMTPREALGITARELIEGARDAAVAKVRRMDPTDIGMMFTWIEHSRSYMREKRRLMKMAIHHLCLTILFAILYVLMSTSGPSVAWSIFELAVLMEMVWFVTSIGLLFFMDIRMADTMQNYVSIWYPVTRVFCLFGCIVIFAMLWLIVPSSSARSYGGYVIGSCVLFVAELMYPDSLNGLGSIVFGSDTGVTTMDTPVSMEYFNPDLMTGGTIRDHCRTARQRRYDDDIEWLRVQIHSQSVPEDEHTD